MRGSRWGEGGDVWKGELVEGEGHMHMCGRWYVCVCVCACVKRENIIIAYSCKEAKLKFFSLHT